MRLEFDCEKSHRRLMKSRLALLALLVASMAFGRAQGTITFLNRSGGLQAPIFGPELDFINFGGDWANAKTGNTATNLPAGTQSYAGTPLTGFTVRFWAAPGVVTDGHLLLPGDAAATTGSGSLAGYFPTTLVNFAGLPASGLATVQVRAYDPNNILQFGFDSLGGIAAASALFTVDIGTSATGLRSFSVGWLDSSTLAPYVPEPATATLLIIGCGLLLARRRPLRIP